MKVSDFGSSEYIKKADVDPPILVTIKSTVLKNMAKDNEPPEMKPVVEFLEIDKKLILNKTNFNRISEETQEEDSDNWVGKKIVLWHNPDVELGGKRVGGTRVRGANPKSVQEPVVPDREAALDAARTVDDALPF